MTDSIKPLLIALCGAPFSGKSEVQKLLENEYAIKPIDDGAPLRRLTQSILAHQGIKYEDCLSQDGKKLPIVVRDDEQVELRWALGEIGNAVEAIFGANAIPEAAIHNAMRHWLTGTKFPEVMGYSFGSVRRQQGRVYQKKGGFVVEIIRPNISSRYSFDGYDKSVVNFTIMNDGSLADLRDSVKRTIFAISEKLQDE